MSNLVKTWIIGYVDSNDTFLEECIIQGVCGRLWKSEPAKHDMSFSKFKNWKRTRGLPCSAIFIGSYPMPAELLSVEI
ncbi:TPA: hypothetical protein ACUNCG_000448 [Aeromonas hydrophila]